MKCHYEVLSVGRDAEETEIKKSYRKLALQYHPDKNPDRIDEVTELFREVQSAYDVLMDPQERAWYDKHRESILRGGDDYVDDHFDLMQFFNPSVYKNFDDSAKGFYTVFREAFCRLAKEDEEFKDEEEGLIIPEFGYSYSDYETVILPFYNYWLAYYTKKSFTWKDKYDIRQAANRPTQRLMEKENKKIRDGCRKKRNEEVRALVSYVRKRDKRVIEEVKRLKLKQEEQQRKTAEKRELQKKDRSKILDNYEEPEWTQLDTSKLDVIDSHFDNQFGSTHVNSDSDSDYDVLYCIACDKNFKSDKALANHEKSKKHKENVQLIKNELDADIFNELCLEDNTLNVVESNDKELKRVANEDFDDLENDGILPRLSSMNLPENIVKRNVIEKNTKSGEDYSIQSSKKSKKKKKRREKLLNIEEDSDDEDNEDVLGEAAVFEDNDKNETVEANTENSGKVIEKNTKSGEDYSIQSSKKSKKKKKRKEMLLNVEEDSDYEDNEDVLGEAAVIEDNDKIKTEKVIEKNTKSGEDYSIQSSKKSKKKKKRKEMLLNVEEDSDYEDNEDVLEEAAVIEDNDKIKTVKENTENTESDISDTDTDTDTDTETKTFIAAENSITNEKSDNAVNNEEEIINANIVEEDEDDDSDKEEWETKKREKKNQKNNPDEVTGSFPCRVCTKEFPSKSKLFKHIKAEGHAQLEEGRTSSNCSNTVNTTKKERKDRRKIEGEKVRRKKK